jgi:aspartyl-tRNA(Asn)/glutamyl-tRNA(Gln) amidotransferase subunit B
VFEEERIMQWETVIGLETHVQLSTRSKIFSGASTAFGAEPNTQACEIDVALPGVLPVLNAAAVEKAMRLGLAVGATVNRRSVFARKNYFYPDLPKGYQISQYEIPIVQHGSLEIVLGESTKTIRLTRAHLEEDAGKSLHEDFHGMTGIDLNRAGTPLLEIVSEPDMRSAAEAVAYGKTLHALVRWLDICDGNMQEGSFRMDANVSVRPLGTTDLGTRCEIKNLNSFRFLERAIEYEARRQVEILEDGGTIRQETRLYDAERDETRAMRSKEDAHDYRYFPDPDLLPLEISADALGAIAQSMPELPHAKRNRFVSALGLSPYDASLLTASRELAQYYEEASGGLSGSLPKLVANWMTGALAARLNESGYDIAQSKVAPGQLRALVERVGDGTLSNKTAREVFEALWAGEGEVDAIIERRGLRQISDSSELDQLADEVLARNAGQVADYRAGKAKAFNALVGQVMKASQGKANPQQVNEILRRKLGTAQ